MPDFDPPAFLEEFGRVAGLRGFESRCLAETSAGPVMAYTSGLVEGTFRYLSAGIHGDEPAGPLAALELLRRGHFDHGWAVCPALNPTGLIVGTRENEAGIDLNRDYRRFDTAEVSGHVEWLKTLPIPRSFISLHEDWESTGFYFYEINLGEDRPDRAESLLKAVEPHLPREPAAVIDDHETREPGWIFHRAEADLPDEWPEAIYLAKSGCPISFTFETPSAMALENRIAAHIAAFKAAI